MIYEWLKIIRNFFNLYLRMGKNKFKVKGTGNKITKDLSSNIRYTQIVIHGKNNQVLIGKNCKITGLRILIEGNNNTIMIGDRSVINASAIQPTIINAFGSKTISIGEESLLSNNIEIHTTDYHGLYNIHGDRINPDKDIKIGKKVWIGLGVKILKGTEVADGCIIGAGTILSGKYNERNVVIVGNPGKIIKKNIYWENERINKRETIEIENIGRSS